MTTIPSPTDALMAELFGTIAQSHGLDADIGRAAAMHRHPASGVTAAYMSTDERPDAQVYDMQRYRARGVVRGQLGAGDLG